MTDISLIQYARLLGANTVIGMAQKVGLTPPPPPISVRNLIDLAGLIIKPLAPVDLQPQDGASGISNNPDLFFVDPGAGTPAAAGQFDYIVTQNNVVVGSPPLTGGAATPTPLTPPGVKWFVPLPPGKVTLGVSGRNRAGEGPPSFSTFTVSSPPPPPPPVNPTITASIGSDDKVTVNGQGFNKSQTVNLKATVAGGPSTPPTLPNNTQDDRSQLPQTTADPNGSFTTLVILPQNFGSVQFQDGTTSHVRAGETIAVIAKNDNVNDFTPGPGVSNAVTMTAPATV